MRGSDVAAVSAWLVEAGLAGLPETEMMQGFCMRCRTAGMRLSRGLTLVDTPHPVYEGRACHWREESALEAAMRDYGRTDSGEAAETWQRGVFHHLVTTGGADMRCRIARRDHPDFQGLSDFRGEGYTDTSRS